MYPQQNTDAKVGTCLTYLTVKQFCQRNPGFALGGMRARIFHEHENGLSKSGAIVRNGRRVLINEAKFFKWLESPLCLQNPSHYLISKKAREPVERSSTGRPVGRPVTTVLEDEIPEIEPVTEAEYNDFMSAAEVSGGDL